MNSELQAFNFEDEQVHVISDNQADPWFVAKDVCNVLGTKTQDVRRILDADEVTEITNVDKSYVGKNGGRTPLIINEAGFYKLVLRSRKQVAKPFQRWVAHDVIPQIRKTGGYIPTSNSDTDEDIMARALMIAQRTLDAKNKQIIAQQQQIIEQQPKVLFADAVAASDNSVLIGELAKILKQNGATNMGQNRLFQRLRNDGYLGIRGENRNMPTQKAMELGVLEIKKRLVTKPDGSSIVVRTPKVTGKGQQYFINKYIKD